MRLPSSAIMCICALLLTAGGPAFSAPDKPKAQEPKKKLSKLERDEEKRKKLEVERKRLTDIVAALKTEALLKNASNNKWYKSAAGKEASLYDRARRYDKKGDFRKARTYYRKALKVRVNQWVIITKLSVKELEKSETPLKFDRARFTLYTRSTEGVFKRLKLINADIIKSDSSKAMASGDEALKKSFMVAAYKAYAKAEELLDRLPDTKESQALLAAARERRGEVVAIVSDPLNVADAAIKAGKYPEAADALERFKETYDTFKIDKAVYERQKALYTHPEMRKEQHIRAAKSRLESAKASVEREHYAVALRKLTSLSKNFADTESAVEGAALFKELSTDPAVAAIIRQTAVDDECRILMGKGMLRVRQRKFQEALACYAEVIRKYPDSDWAKKATAARSALEAQLQP
jgi:tetratricopeptide (TPR) repeat protein